MTDRTPVTERSEGTIQHSTLVTGSDEGGPVTERSEGTIQHSTLVTGADEGGPATELDPRYGEITEAFPWPEALELLVRAELCWLSTVRPDGRPHVTPLPAVWHGGAPHFCTGPEERKARNLADNPHCVLTTGQNTDHRRRHIARARRGLDGEVRQLLAVRRRGWDVPAFGRRRCGGVPGRAGHRVRLHQGGREVRPDPLPLLTGRAARRGVAL
jgi:hypothetical protein